MPVMARLLAVVTHMLSLHAFTTVRKTTLNTIPWRALRVALFPLTSSSLGFHLQVELPRILSSLNSFTAFLMDIAKVSLRMIALLHQVTESSDMLHGDIMSYVSSQPEPILLHLP
jgi:hypothetical protein